MNNLNTDIHLLIQNMFEDRPERGLVIFALVKILNFHRTEISTELEIKKQIEEMKFLIEKMTEFENKYEKEFQFFLNKFYLTSKNKIYSSASLDKFQTTNKLLLNLAVQNRQSSLREEVQNVMKMTRQFSIEAHPRDISLLTGLNKNVIDEVLKDLEEIGIIRNLRFYNYKIISPKIQDFIRTSNVVYFTPENNLPIKSSSFEKEETSQEIKDIRNALNLSQEAFGHLLGVTGATVNRWERGAFKPSKLAMEKIKTIKP